MLSKLARIFGIIGGALTLLSYLLLVAECVYTLTLPDNEVHFESKGYAPFILVIGIIFFIIAVAGFIGSLQVDKKPILAGALMVSSGVLCLFGLPLSVAGLNSLLHFPQIGYVIFIPPLLLIVAGLLSWIFKSTASTKPQDHQPDSIQ